MAWGNQIFALAEIRRAGSALLSYSTMCRHFDCLKILLCLFVSTRHNTACIKLQCRCICIQPLLHGNTLTPIRMFSVVHILPERCKVLLAAQKVVVSSASEPTHVSAPTRQRSTASEKSSRHQTSLQRQHLLLLEACTDDYCCIPLPTSMPPLLLCLGCSTEEAAAAFPKVAAKLLQCCSFSCSSDKASHSNLA